MFRPSSGRSRSSDCCPHAIYAFRFLPLPPDPPLRPARLPPCAAATPSPAAMPPPPAPTRPPSSAFPSMRVDRRAARGTADLYSCESTGRRATACRVQISGSLRPRILRPDLQPPK
ncbi:hypothetical protein PVAP13_3NG201552 [Panicum virgatum]|uniref:Uncharacterized protein n=1 Tax=Panicum virgatum TaxID=38727 RepID=A0A8T0UFK7_PANVG|nr:hypothetical protein PVAP13_3NG201552 [Panicum virgatum]